MRFFVARRENCVTIDSALELAAMFKDELGTPVTVVEIS